MLAALKSLSDNSYIWSSSILGSVDCLFSVKLWFSWFLVWWVIFLLYLGHYKTIDPNWSYFLVGSPHVERKHVKLLSGLHWYYLSKSRTLILTASLQTDGVEVQLPVGPMESFLVKVGYRPIPPLCLEVIAYVQLPTGPCRHEGTRWGQQSD